MNHYLSIVIATILIPLSTAGLLNYDNIFLRFIFIFVLIVYISDILYIYIISRLIIKGEIQLSPDSSEEIFADSLSRIMMRGNRGLVLVPGFICSVSFVIQSTDYLYRRRVLSKIETGSEGEFFVYCHFDRYGVYKALKSYIHIGDLFGLVRFRFSLPVNGEIRVHPRIKSIYERLVSDAGGDEVIKARATVNSTDFFESRKYYPGDDPRRINWKLYARFDELYIRETEKIPPGSGEVSIVFAPHSTVVSEYTETTSYFLGFVKQLVADNRPVSVVIYSGLTMGVKNWTEYNQLYETVIKGSYKFVIDKFDVKGPAIVFASLEEGVRLSKAMKLHVSYYGYIFASGQIPERLKFTELLIIDRDDSFVGESLRLIKSQYRISKYYKRFNELVFHLTGLNSIDLTDDIKTSKYGLVRIIPVVETVLTDLGVLNE